MAHGAGDAQSLARRVAAYGHVAAGTNSDNAGGERSLAPALNVCSLASSTHPQMPGTGPSGSMDGASPTELD
jgi:hypothetical protein